MHLIYRIKKVSVLNLVYEIPEDGPDVSKNVGEVKDYTFKCVCNLWINSVLYLSEY
jgi:hypothetical protein